MLSVDRTSRTARERGLYSGERPHLSMWGDRSQTRPPHKTLKKWAAAKSLRNDEGSLK
jgi:hypothetical protein